MVVLVAGAGGQLGQSLQHIASNYAEIEFVFCNSSELDITNLSSVETIFSKHKPQFCINAAAYTAVDKAESEPEKAYLINVSGSKNLAIICNQFSATLLHVSTDFVFDGTATKPYLETDNTNPTSVYGQTKLDGEKAIQSICAKHYIIRTSWVYSQFANNFMKTMLRLAAQRDTLSVVNDQIGTPTNAVDLAEILINIIKTDNQQSDSNNRFGIYNFSNEGSCSWFDFAKQIFENNNVQIALSGIPSSEYPTPAKRPHYSVLDKTKIKTTFGIEIKTWQESLKNVGRLNAT